LAAELLFVNVKYDLFLPTSAGFKGVDTIDPTLPAPLFVY